MGYYSVIILTRIQRADQRYAYKPESIYFGESERLMQTSFYEAVRKARRMPVAESVVVWHDLEELVKVYIEHEH